MVILSGYDHQNHVGRRAQWRFWLSKALAPEVTSLRSAMAAGEPPDGAFEMAVPPAGAGHTASEQDDVLPPQQGQVLKLVAQGFSNKAIAKRLDVSEHTIRNR